MTHLLVVGLGLALGAVALAYFGFLAARPAGFARVLMRSRYEALGWTEQRLAIRVRILGIAGMLVSVAAILLAIVRFAR